MYFPIFKFAQFNWIYICFSPRPIFRPHVQFPLAWVSLCCDWGSEISTENPSPGSKRASRIDRTLKLGHNRRGVGIDEWGVLKPMLHRSANLRSHLPIYLWKWAAAWREKHREEGNAKGKHGHRNIRPANIFSNGCWYSSSSSCSLLVNLSPLPVRGFLWQVEGSHESVPNCRYPWGMAKNMRLELRCSKGASPRLLMMRLNADSSYSLLEQSGASSGNEQFPAPASRQLVDVQSLPIYIKIYIRAQI